jgi:hypothetical protein
MNTKYVLKLANPQAADRPVWGWPPGWLIIITPNYHPFSVRLITELTARSSTC